MRNFYASFQRPFFLLVFIFLNANVFGQEARYVDGEVIIMFDKSFESSSFEKVIQNEFDAKVKLSHAEVLSKISNIHLYSFDPSAMDETRVLDVIQKAKGVRAAQFNHYVQERQTPNDVQYASQWHHQNSGDNDIDSDLAWDITTGGETANGDEIVVCVIEPGGANYNHSDLIANHWVNESEIPNNGVDDDLNGYIDDYNGWDPQSNSDNISSGGHGTAVSGMIGAVGNNSSGGAGVNWDVKIMQVEVASLTESNVISSYAYPQTMRSLYNSSAGAEGAFVVATNASWGIDFANPANYPVWCAYYDDLGEAGILNCGATSNSNVNIDQVGDMPTGCASDYMISVTATNSSDQRTFSGYGATTIDLAAPGQSVLLPSGSSSYSTTSGTSFASPCVAGAIALVYSAPCASLASLSLSNPQAAADAVRGYILDGVDLVSNLQTETVTGGRLNVKSSIDLALGDCGPPPNCEPLGISVEASCNYNSMTSSVEADIQVQGLFESDFCSADQICFQIDGEALVCIPLSDGELTNQSDYFLNDLPSNTSVSVYYTAGGVNSETVELTTENCSSLTPGCTDQTALNYNPSADLDDGSCEYPCTDVTFSITTDCWGNEVSWDLVNDESGEVVASVNQGAYDDELTYSFESCLPPGCYTFTISDSFGDGMNGSSYSSCGVDGSYQMTDADGNVLFEMGDADYGDQAVHTFCVEGITVPPCEAPYPQVQNISSTVQSNGVLFEWDPILGSIGCQFQMGIVGGGGTSSANIIQPEVGEFFVSNNFITPGVQYRWRVRCACSRNPLIIGPWSSKGQFIVGSGLAQEGFGAGNDLLSEVVLIPNPSSGSVQLSFTSANEELARISVIDMTGKLVYQGAVQAIVGQNNEFLDLSSLERGIYIVSVEMEETNLRTRLIIN